MTRASIGSLRLTSCVFAVLAFLNVVVHSGQSQGQDAATRLVVMIRGTIGDAPVTGAGIVLGVVNDRLYVATANHVVRRGPREAQGLQVLLQWLPGEWVPATLLEHADTTLDLAVLAVPGASKFGAPEFAWQVLSGPESLASGSKVFPIGYPAGNPWFKPVQPNLVSIVTNSVIRSEGNLVPGHSGGVLVTEDGGIVGMVSSIDSLLGESQRIDRVVEKLTEWGYRVSLTWKPTAPKSEKSAIVTTGGTSGETTPRTARNAGEVFRDCPYCPEMVVIPAGTFTMGSPLNDDESYAEEGPTHEVNIRSFALGRFEVTRSEFQMYVTETGPQQLGCSIWNGRGVVYDASRSWQEPGAVQTAADPVVCVDWFEATGYVKWLLQRTKQDYRLASEAEWEYGARATTTTRRFWGNDWLQTCGFANVFDETARLTFPMANRPFWGMHQCSDGYAFTAPAGRFRANPFGLHDMLGNAWEWVQDCFNDNYEGAPNDGGPWTTGNCENRVLRGGSWGSEPRGVRSAFRYSSGPTDRSDDVGFRVARTLQ